MHIEENFYPSRQNIIIEYSRVSHMIASMIDCRKI